MIQGLCFGLGLERWMCRTRSLGWGGWTGQKMQEPAFDTGLATLGGGKSALEGRSQVLVLLGAVLSGLVALKPS